MVRSRACMILVGVVLCLGACTSDVAIDDATPATTVQPTTTASTEPPTTLPPVTDAPAAVSDTTLASLTGTILAITDSGQLVSVRADGSDRTTLDPATDALVSQPTWAADGRAASWTRVTTEGASVRVVDFAADTTTDIATATPAFYHAWNADGDAIATLRSGGGPIQLDVHDPAAGTTEEIAVGQPFYLDWQSTGTAAVIAVNGASVARIDVSALTGQDLQLPAPVGVFQSPSVLDDGSFLVSLAANDGFELVRIFPDDSVERIARFDGAIAMATTSDNSRVAVLVSRDPNQPQLEQASFQTLPSLPSGQVSIVDLTTGNVETLPHRNVIAINWSPDGTWLAALQVDDTAARWIHRSDGTTVIGPDHRPSPTLRDQILPFADQYNQSHTWWSPDNRAFLITGTIGDRSGIWVDVINDDAPPAFATDGSLAFWSPG